MTINKLKISKKGRTVAPIINRGMKVGRNSACPCQSGLKFKNCCMPNKKVKIPKKP